ncbi:MAG: hypothetical protein ABIP27_19170 [Flavobacterium circumlabens]|uniref:hypothetical protein n=1 Tax=Flavobacterium circumlabens TaxID=2133765 RepID=UPI0032659FBB
MESLKPNFLDVFQGKIPLKMSDKKTLPTLDCGTCGNCEKNFHKDPQSNVNNGFCVRFKENTPLDQKNPSCWTSKNNTYYEDLSKMSPSEKKQDLHKRNKRADKLKIQFTNQQNLFQ